MALDTERFKIVAKGIGRIAWSGTEPFSEQFSAHAAEVGRLWVQAVSDSNGHLFNGTFLNCVGIELGPKGWLARTHFDEYKYLLAQRLRPEFQLPVTPIGVSGISILRESGVLSVVVAKRASHMTQYPEYLELVPSGTIDQVFAGDDGYVDFEGKLLEEFVEETGLPKSCVAKIETIGLVLDIPDNNFDVCCRLELDCERDDLVKGILESGEYCDPQFIPWGLLPDFARKHGERMLPTSLAILELLK